MSEAKNRPRRGGEQPDEEVHRQRTERLNPEDAEWSAQEPVNPGWRRERSATRSARRRGGALPASPQEFQLWLQGGGWRYLAGIAVLLVVLLIAMLSFSRSDQREAGLGFGEPTALPESGAGSDSGLLLPTAGAAVTAPPSAAPAAAAQPFVVTGTAAEGLFLRPEPNTNGPPLTTLPEGTRVDQIGEDFIGPDRIWRNVRGPDGQEGWVAADFLQPAP